MTRMYGSYKQRYSTHRQQEQWQQQQRNAYNDQLSIELDVAVLTVEQQWPAQAVNVSTVQRALQSISSWPLLSNIWQLQSKLTALFIKWHRNNELHEFLEEVTRRLTTLPVTASTVTQQQLPTLRVDATCVVARCSKAVLRLCCPPPVLRTNATTAAALAAVYTTGHTADAEVTWSVSAQQCTSVAAATAMTVPPLPEPLQAAVGDCTVMQELKAELLESWRQHHHETASAATCTVVAAAVVTLEQARNFTEQLLQRRARLVTRAEQA
jgi:hypothetical protein